MSRTYRKKYVPIETDYDIDNMIKKPVYYINHGCNEGGWRYLISSHDPVLVAGNREIRFRKSIGRDGNKAHNNDYFIVKQRTKYIKHGEKVRPQLAQEIKNINSGHTDIDCAVKSYSKMRMKTRGLWWLYG